MPSVSVRECKTAAEVFANYKEVGKRNEARERMCLMKILDNTTLKPRPKDGGAAKLQEIIAGALPAVAATSIAPISDDAPLNEAAPIFPFISLTKIIVTVAKFYGIKPVELISDRKETRVLRPRQVAIYLARDLTPFSFAKIGARVGDRDHSTVLHAARKIEFLVTIDRELADEVNYLRSSLEECGSIRNQELSGASSSAP